MIFNLLSLSPYPWFFLAALGTAGAASSLTRRVKHKRHPEKAGERKIFFTALSGSLAFLFALGGVIVPGPEKLADPLLFVFFLAVAVVFFLAFRFKKAAGIPFFLLIGALVLSVVLFFQAVVAFTGQTEIGKLKVRSVDDGVIKFDFVDHNGESTPLAMPGTLLGAEVKEIIFDDFFVFFGARTAYRFVGLKSAGVREGSEMTEELRAYEFPKPAGLQETVYQFVQDNQAWIPGVKTAQIQVTYMVVKPGATYSIMIQHDSGVEITD